MKPTGKTPYEIRLELLQLAQHILHNEYLAKIGANKDDTNASEPTTDQIIAEAEKLNSFVSKANSSN